MGAADRDRRRAGAPGTGKVAGGRTFRLRDHSATPCISVTSEANVMLTAEARCASWRREPWSKGAAGLCFSGFCHLLSLQPQLPAFHLLMRGHKGLTKSEGVKWSGNSQKAEPTLPLLHPVPALGTRLAVWLAVSEVRCGLSTGLSQAAPCGALGLGLVYHPFPEGEAVKAEVSAWTSTL